MTDFESKISAFDELFDGLERDLKKLFDEDGEEESMSNMELLEVLLNQFFKLFKIRSVCPMITCDNVLIHKYESANGNVYDYKIDINTNNIWERESKRALGAFFQLILEDRTKFDLTNAQRLVKFIDDGGGFQEFVNSNIYFTPQATILKKYRIEQTQCFI